VNVSGAVVAIVDGFRLSGKNVGMLCEHSNHPQLNMKTPILDIICFSSTIRIDCDLPIREKFIIRLHTYIHSIFQRCNKVDVEHKITIGTVKTSCDNKIQIMFLEIQHTNKTSSLYEEMRSDHRINE
jgi:hypothetical protein